MAKIGDSLFKKWNDGDVIKAKEYNQEHEIIRTAVNDNFERLIKEVRLVDDNNDLIIAQTMSDILNYLTFKQGNNVKLSLDGEAIVIEVVQGEGSGLDADTLDGEHKGYFATKLEHDNLDTRLEAHRISDDHDVRYMTRDELAPYLQGGDTQIRVDIFKIISSNNGDGTYTYTLNGVEQVGSLDNEGRQILVLSGSYDMGVNHIEALIDDTLHRSSASGGLVEIDGNTIKLTDVLASGQEVTVKYYERIGIAGEHNVVVGEHKPPPTRGATLWFKVVG